MMRSLIAVALGLGLAAAIACGGARKSSSPAAMGAPAPPGGDPRIAELDARIDANLARLGLARPAPPPAACIQPPCSAEAMTAGGAPLSTDDPSCHPGSSAACDDVCALADEICTSAAKICRIAGELGGNDAWANEKCAGGKASCDAAHARCCGCQP